MLDDDASFRRLLREGDPGALSRMAEIYGDRLLRGAFFLCRNESEAQDLVQETLFQAIRGISAFRGESQVYGWLYRILRNIYLNQRRRDGRWSAFVRKHFFSPADDSLVFPNNDHSPDPGIDAAIGALPPKQREIIHLRYGEGFTIREIGEALGVSPGTVKSRLFHATLKLKRRLLRDPGQSGLPDEENPHEL
jgi:RNA polymerase sigma-70 factor (ECF subfamily)